MNENEQYEQVCKNEFADIKELLKEIDKNLFRGNGHPSFSVQLDRLNNFKAFSCWLLGIVTTTSLGLVGRLVYVLLKR